MTSRLSSYILFLCKKHNPRVSPDTADSEIAYSETEFMLLTRKQTRSFDINIMTEIELNMYMLNLYKDGTYHKSYNKLTKLMKMLGVSHEERRKQHFKLFFNSHIKKKTADTDYICPSTLETLLITFICWSISKSSFKFFDNFSV